MMWRSGWERECCTRAGGVALWLLDTVVRSTPLYRRLPACQRWAPWMGLVYGGSADLALSGALAAGAQRFFILSASHVEEGIRRRAL